MPDWRCRWLRTLPRLRLEPEPVFNKAQLPIVRVEYELRCPLHNGIIAQAHHRLRIETPKLPLAFLGLACEEHLGRTDRYTDMVCRDRQKIGAHRSIRRKQVVLVTAEFHFAPVHSED